MGDGHLSVVDGDDPQKKPRGPTREAQAVVQANLVFQAVASGLTVVEAAGQLGLSTSTADRLFHEALDAAHEWSAEEKAAWLHVELETLRLLQRKYMSMGLKGSIGAGQLVLQIQERRSKYLDLDAAIRVKVEHGVESSVVDDIRALLDEQVPLDIPELPAMTAPGYGVVIEHQDPDDGDVQDDVG